jgi:tetratricopeptide (TPR) repeat protein
MRARLALAQTLWEFGRKQEAVVHYRELLRLNPNDNQGVRELVVPAMLSLGDDAGAEEILAMYKNDALPSTAYNRALLEFRREGDSAASRRLLTCALHENPYVPSYLLGEIELPDVLPEIITFGGEDEAVAYVAESKQAWQSTQGALDWLRARRLDAKKLRRKAVRTGEGSARGGTSKKKPASRGAKPPTKRRSKS